MLYTRLLLASLLAGVSHADSDYFTLQIANSDPKLDGYNINTVSDNSLVLTESDSTITAKVLDDGTLQTKDGKFIGRNNWCFQRNFLRYVNETTGAVNLFNTFSIVDGYLQVGSKYTNGSWWWGNSTFTWTDSTASGYASTHPVALYTSHDNAVRDGYAEGGVVFQIKAVGSDGNTVADFTSEYETNLEIVTEDNDLDTIINNVETIYATYTSTDMLSNVKDFAVDVLTYFYNCKDDTFLESLISAARAQSSTDSTFSAVLASRLAGFLEDVWRMGSNVGGYTTYLEFDVERLLLFTSEYSTDASSSESTKADSILSILVSLLATGDTTCTATSSFSSKTSSSSCVPEVTTSLLTSTWDEMEYMTMNGDSEGMWMMMETTSTITKVSTIACRSSSSGYSNSSVSSTTSSSSSSAAKQSAVTTTLTVTSCSDNKCETAYITTIYTTTCPLSTATHSVFSNNSNSGSGNRGSSDKTNEEEYGGDEGAEGITETVTCTENSCAEAATSAAEISAEAATSDVTTSTATAISIYTGAAAKVSAVGSILLLSVLSFFL